MHYVAVGWTVLFHDAFEDEFNDLPEAVQDELLAQAKLLEIFGPTLGRPRVDTLKGSRHANMKELRFDADGGVWRVAFAFDPKRRGVLLVAGDKSGGARSASTEPCSKLRMPGSMHTSEGSRKTKNEDAD